MLYREIICVCSQIHTKHINTLCGQNMEMLSVKPGGTYSDRWTSEVFLLLVSKAVLACSLALCNYIEI